MQKTEIPVRLVVLNPLPGVTYAVQRGRDELAPPAARSNDALVFEFTLFASGDRVEAPRLTGPFAQGPVAGRFVYVNSGTLAGQADSCWTRRAKVHLTSISWRDIDAVSPGGDRVLEAVIEGVGRDGGPACATVPLAQGWRVVNSHPSGKARASR